MRLYPPGTRNRNRFYIARGKIAGTEYEVSTDTTDQRAAQRFAREFRQRALEQAARERAQPREAPRTFADVSAIYREAAGLNDVERTRLDKLDACRFRLGPDEPEQVFGALPVADILPMHLTGAAHALYAGLSNATKNREAMTPAAAVLHFAAENQLCPYMRVKKLPEPKPKSRRPADHILPLLIANADDADLRRFLTIIRWQGWRASETIALGWQNVSLQDAEFALWIGKARTEKRVPMHGAVLEELASVPPAERTGKLFRWASYQSMDYHLKKLCKRLGVTFTPHQARWSFASDLNDLGSTDADILPASSWTSKKSIGRYIATDLKRGREVIGRLGRKG